MGLFGVGCALEPLRARWLGVEPCAPYGLREAGAWSIACLAAVSCTAATLAIYNPWGVRVLSVPFTMASNSYWGAHLIEFRSPWSFPLTMLIAYWLWLAAVVVALIFAARRVHAGLILIASAYAVISLEYVRMVYALAIVSTPLVAASPALGCKRAPALAVRRGVAIGVFAALVCSAPLYSYRDHAPGFGWSSYAWPRDQFAFIRVHGLRGRSFVSDVWVNYFSRVLSWAACVLRSALGGLLRGLRAERVPTHSLR